MATFSETVNAAIRDFSDRGYVSEDQMKFWMDAIRVAAESATTSQATMERLLKDSLRAIYARLVERHGVLQKMPGVPRYTLANVAQRLRTELDRRIVASASLIKLNREQAIDATMRRFVGWASAQPVGGSAEPERAKAKEDVKKSMNSLPFVERRVLVDQGHKLTATIQDVVAVGGGAIAAKWFSHWRQANYSYREDHKERDGRVYLIRDSWAANQGLIKPGPPGYTDQITQPGEEIFCRCKFQYFFHLRQLPDDMITAKGREALEKVRMS